jgi:hypothetical protein
LKPLTCLSIEDCFVDPSERMGFTITLRKQRSIIGVATSALSLRRGFDWGAEA